MIISGIPCEEIVFTLLGSNKTLLVNKISKNNVTCNNKKIKVYLAFSSNRYSQYIDAICFLHFFIPVHMVWILFPLILSGCQHVFITNLVRQPWKIDQWISFCLCIIQRNWKATIISELIVKTPKIAIATDIEKKNTWFNNTK